MLQSTLRKIVCVAILTSIASFTYAEDSVPVYDVDSYTPQYEGQDGAAVAGGSDLEQPQFVSPRQASGGGSIEKRLSHAEQQLSNLQQIDLPTRLDSIQTDLQSLRGQVEELTHKLNGYQKKGRLSDSAKSDTELQAMHAQLDEMSHHLEQMQSQLDKHGAKQTASNTKSTTRSSPDDTTAPDTNTKNVANDTKTKPAPLTAVDADLDSDTLAKADTDNPKAAEQPNVAEEQQIYQTAYDLIKAKKYNEAISALQKMLQKYPSGQFAANAHYWLGELYGLLGKNDKSAVEFSTVVQNYPDSPRVSDAQLNLGIVYLAQFKWRDAKSSFKRTINRYPGTAAARLASEQLKQMKAAGH